MAKSSATAKKRNNKWFGFFKKNEHKTDAHFFFSRLVIIAMLGLVASSLLSFIYSKFSKKEPSLTVVKTEPPKPKRKEVKPLDDSQREEVKEYNFYTQLENRTFYIEGEEKTGGEALEMMLQKFENAEKERTVQPMIPPIVLESLATHVGRVADTIQPSPSTSTSTTAPPKLSQKSSITLQTGSFLSQSEAINQRTLLENQGFSPKISESRNSQNKLIYRVHIGPYSPSELPKIESQLRQLRLSFFKVKS